MAQAQKTDPLDLLFDKQLEARAHPSRFKAFLVGRRGGKTTTFDWDLAHSLLTGEQDDHLFISQTSETARDLCWVPLERAAQTYGWPIRFDNSKRIAYGPKGARLLVKGSETIREMEKRRGLGPKTMRVDECGAIRPSSLKYLVEDVLEPMMMDSAESTLWLAGTPNPTPSGYFHDITNGLLPGWDVFRWDWRSNPHVDQTFVAGLMERRNWTWDTPTFRREYLAEWVTDPGRQVFRFDRARNTLAQLPQLLPGDHWVYGMAMDFGVGDATACVVLAWAARYGRAVYVVDAWADTGMSVGDSCNRGRVTWDKWRPSVLVGDVNGLGKYAEVEWNRRFQDIPMVPADKLKKRSALEFASDAMLHTSLGGDARDHYGLGILSSVDQRLGQQLATILWDEDRKDIQEGQDDDLAMALVYGWRASPAFLNLQASDSVESPPKTQAQRFVEAHRGVHAPPKPLERSFTGAFRRRRK